MIDDRLQAWVHLAPADATPAAGALDGVAFGVKDIIDVAGMPTGLGLPGYDARTALNDAWCVALLRAAGARPIGKTHTTALAFRDPAPTAHPHLAGRSPGGSSAGSAAAVAAGDVPLALGTQTLGSVVRPAAFCGVVGFKPTYGRIPTVGVNPLAPSIDTIGVLARDVGVAKAAADVLLGETLQFDAPALRIALLADYLPDRLPANVRDAVTSRARTLLATLDAHVSEIVLPQPAAMLEPIDTIVAFEAHAALRGFLRHGTLPPAIGDLICRGAAIGTAPYRAAQSERRRLQASVFAELGRYDAVLLPFANVAPARDSTGDGMPQAPWTAWGVPMLALPVGRLDDAPIALGIVAMPGADAAVLEIARRLEQGQEQHQLLH